MQELGYETSLETMRTQLRRYLTDEHSEIFVAVIGGDLVGVVSGHLIPALHEPGNIGRITALVVAKKARSRRIASRLVNELEKWFLKNRCLRFEVTSGKHRNAAHLFYESLGYAPAASRFLKAPQHNEDRLW
ncbi:MAG: GNAT family N-acetyltransferase [Gammaproteobacteria bacterium]|nr:GNAT family N-acetyltransferase [Gammaproteobacteria bacterium]